MEDELKELRTENQTMRERLVNEILDLRKEKEKLQKEVSRLNGVVKKYREILGQPKSLASGIETAINYIVDNFFLHKLQILLGESLEMWRGQ